MHTPLGHKQGHRETFTFPCFMFLLLTLSLFCSSALLPASSPFHNLLQALGQLHNGRFSWRAPLHEVTYTQKMHLRFINRTQSVLLSTAHLWGLRLRQRVVCRGTSETFVTNQTTRYHTSFTGPKPQYFIAVRTWGCTCTNLHRCMWLKKEIDIKIKRHEIHKTRTWKNQGFIWELFFTLLVLNICVPFLMCSFLVTVPLSQLLARDIMSTHCNNGPVRDNRQKVIQFVKRKTLVLRQSATEFLAMNWSVPTRRSFEW